MTLSFRDISLPVDEGLWDKIADACPDAWFRHTSQYFMQHKISLAEAGVSYADRSFLLLRNEEVIGLAPLLITATTVGHSVLNEASIAGAALPWPCIALKGDDLKAVDIAAFQEIERRTKAGAAGRISIVLSPALSQSDDYDRVANVVFELQYTDLSYPSHYMTLDSGSLDKVRERYRRNVKKNMVKYEISVIRGPDITNEIIAAYSVLHEKDAGRYVRSLATYQQQAEMAKSGKGFWVVAATTDTHCPVGILQINKYKAAAYDASVAVDPDYQEDHISHLLKWKAIETLLAEGIYGYELGEKATLPTLRHQPSRKNYGISFFKEGWSRGEMRTVYAVEKYLTKEHLDASLMRDASDLATYFKL